MTKRVNYLLDRQYSALFGQLSACGLAEYVCQQQLVNNWKCKVAQTGPLVTSVTLCLVSLFLSSGIYHLVSTYKVI